MEWRPRRDHAASWREYGSNQWPFGAALGSGCSVPEPPISAISGNRHEFSGWRVRLRDSEAPGSVEAGDAYGDHHTGRPHV